MVDKVKRYESGMITNPITLEQSRPIREARQLMEQYSIGGLPVLSKNKLNSELYLSSVICAGRLFLNIEWLCLS